MNEQVTKDDLRQFGLILIDEMRKILEAGKPNKAEDISPEWLKSRAVRKLLDMSAASLQNLRVTGKIRFKKVLGTYYYNKADVSNLFTDK